MGYYIEMVKVICGRVIMNYSMKLLASCLCVITLSIMLVSCGGSAGDAKSKEAELTDAITDLLLKNDRILYPKHIPPLLVAINTNGFLGQIQHWPRSEKEKLKQEIKIESAKWSKRFFAGEKIQVRFAVLNGLVCYELKGKWEGKSNADRAHIVLDKDGVCEIDRSDKISKDFAELQKIIKTQVSEFLVSSAEVEKELERRGQKDVYHQFEPYSDAEGNARPVIENISIANWEHFSIGMDSPKAIGLYIDGATCSIYNGRYRFNIRRTEVRLEMGNRKLEAHSVSWGKYSADVDQLRPDDKMVERNIEQAEKEKAQAKKVGSLYKKLVQDVMIEVFKKEIADNEALKFFREPIQLSDKCKIAGTITDEMSMAIKDQSETGLIEATSRIMRMVSGLATNDDKKSKFERHATGVLFDEEGKPLRNMSVLLVFGSGCYIPLKSNLEQLNEFTNNLQKCLEWADIAVKNNTRGFVKDVGRYKNRFGDAIFNCDLSFETDQRETPVCPELRICSYVSANDDWIVSEKKEQKLSIEEVRNLKEFFDGFAKAITNVFEQVESITYRKVEDEIKKEELFK